MPSSRQAVYTFRSPRLEVDWEPRGRVFFSSLRAFLRGPRAPKGWPLGSYFRDAWVEWKFPRRALAASALWHILIFNFPFPMWQATQPRTRLKPPRIEVTWYIPQRDLPLLAPPVPRAQPKRAAQPDKPVPRRGADAFHPRQTIISAPKVPTHPRQTLIQPDTPPEAPKILPPLPNIVQWTQARQPARPRLRIAPPKLANLRPRMPAMRPAADVPVPAVPNMENQPGELNIAASAMNNPRPRLPMSPMAVPQAGPRQVRGEVGPAPEIGPTVANGETGLHRLIALSATPAPPAPTVNVPPGNLAATFSISPEGTQPGAPGSTGTSPGGTRGAGGGGGNSIGSGSGTSSGPPGVSISGGNLEASSGVAGPPSSPPASSPPARPLPAKPEPRITLTDPSAPLGTGPSRTRPAPALDRIKPQTAPEEILGPKRIYTLYVNMPNLVSAAGSWVLRFAELRPDENGTVSHSSAGFSSPPLATGGDGVGELIGPVPLRKVDPKYPPALVSARIEGEVILYAIIRKDGAVDSIQLVRGIDPQLDQNAMEALARWKFRPAERKGAPVELEAIVHIPFRAVAPL